jgi:hypothetical protein
MSACSLLSLLVLGRKPVMFCARTLMLCICLKPLHQTVRIASHLTASPNDRLANINIHMFVTMQHPDAVVQWVESGRYAVDGAVSAEYQRALARLG